MYKLNLRRRNGRVDGREVWNSGPWGRLCTGDFKVSFEKVKIVPGFLARYLEETERVSGRVPGLTWFVDRH